MHDDDGFAQDGGLPWFIAYFFNIGYTCYGQLTAVKTRYPLTRSVPLLHRELKFRQTINYKADTT